MDLPPPSGGGPGPVPPRRGITLLEMLVVVLIIGILAGITASRLDWNRYRADSVGRGFLAALSQAQRTAVSLQTDVRVTLLAGMHGVQIHEDGNNNGAADVGERISNHVLDHGFLLGKGSMNALPSPADPTELSAVVFRRDGTASRSGAFYLRGNPLGDDCKYCRAVSLQRATGRVVSWSHATGDWVRAN